MKSDTQQELRVPTTTLHPESGAWASLPHWYRRPRRHLDHVRVDRSLLLLRFEHRLPRLHLAGFLLPKLGLQGVAAEMDTCLFPSQRDIRRGETKQPVPGL